MGRAIVRYFDMCGRVPPDGMWSIGDLKVDGRVVLGPMSGFTSSGYREFMRPFGAAVTVTEMVSDMGVIHGAARTEDFLRFGPGRFTGLQLFGSDPASLAEAAEAALRLNPSIDFFDINMGCPVPKVLRSGSGSLLMRDPARCGAIVRAVKRAVDVPVTAKIRLGWSEEEMNFRQVIDELVSADVDAVSLHARTREERYTGTPHYDMIRGLQSEVPVPLVVSGNIFSLEDAVGAVRSTGAAAVMVARGGVGNPYLITQIDRYLRTGEALPNPTISQQVDWCLQLAGMLADEKGEDVAVRRMRSIAPKFIAGCHRCRAYRHRIAVETMDMASLASLLEEVRSARGSERIYAEGRAGPDDE